MDRNRWWGRVALASILLLVASVVAFVLFGRSASEEAAPVAAPPAAARSASGPSATPERAATAAPKASLPQSQSDGDAERWKTAPIEEIKQALYERDIDSVEQLHLLEEFVQIGDADTRDFWNTDWNGIDDWKRNADGFSLEKLDDGTLVFVPGEETKRRYSFHESMSVYEYDEMTQEFVHEVDYYGKSIVNIVKFLREDVMVMMVVSGQKVDLNLYELNRDRRDE